MKVKKSGKVETTAVLATCAKHKLSMTACGLLIHLIGKVHDDSEIGVIALAKSTDTDKMQVAEALDELIKAGILSERKIYDVDGKVVDYQRVLKW